MKKIGWLLSAGLVLTIAPADTEAADHADTPFLVGLGRHDVRITDFYAFAREDNLVLVVAMNPAIPGTATDYVFPSDLSVDINIDNDAAVSDDDPTGLMGGTVLEPGKVHPDMRYKLTFEEDGQPRVHSISGAPTPTNVFVGLRDDPFIRGPRIGANVAAIVIEVPIDDVATHQSTLLLWAASRLDSTDQEEIAALSLRSMFPENACLNTTQPRRHLADCGLEPDVLIFDTDFAASYPNGRDLPDDVVDIVGDPRVLGNDQPFPTENDVPFLTTFPYLAPPH